MGSMKGMRIICPCASFVSIVVWGSVFVSHYFGASSIAPLCVPKKSSIFAA